MMPDTDWTARMAIFAGFELHACENHMSLLPVTINRAVQAAFAVRDVS